MHHHVCVCVLAPCHVLSAWKLMLLPPLLPCCCPPVQVVAEALKSGLLAVNLAAAAGITSPGGEPAQASLLRLLVPVLIEVAAPEAPPTPLLVDMAVKLLTHLASSPAAAEFRAVAADLPASTKQRLQAALQQAGAAAQAAAAPASSGPMQRATVKLNFAAFKK
jgi:hypothetical protein